MSSRSKIIWISRELDKSGIAIEKHKLERLVCSILLSFSFANVSSWSDPGWEEIWINRQRRTQKEILPFFFLSHPSFHPPSNRFRFLKTKCTSNLKRQILLFSPPRNSRPFSLSFLHLFFLFYIFFNLISTEIIRHEKERERKRETKLAEQQTSRSTEHQISKLARRKELFPPSSLSDPLFFGVSHFQACAD